MRKILLFILCLVIYESSYATHNRAGEITFRYVSGLTYEFTVTIFADGNSPAIARKEIEINWGDNLGRDSLMVISEDPVGQNNNSIIRRIWKGTHTFPGAGTYTVSVEDPNRNAGINNIDNSVGVPFYLQTIFRISPIGNFINDSPKLLNDPIDVACVGQPFIYNPGAYDPNGDSLAYELTQSRGVGGYPAAGFYFPPDMKVDSLNGDLTWISPTQRGQVNVAILIKEFRNGILLSTMLRDLQIDIKIGCNNNPPNILSQQEYCIEAGKTLNVPIKGVDQNAQDKVTLSASGGPFEVKNSPAMFNSSSPANPIYASFIWNTLCEHVMLAPYHMSVRAEDNGSFRSSVNLSTYKTHYIYVIAPAPDNFTISPLGTSAKLSWTNGNCKEAVGYKLYRRIDSSGYVSDSCTTGVPNGIGYKQIATIGDVNNTQFVDDNQGLGLVPGIKYCYLVISYFDDGAESYVSEEVCIKIDKVVPLITKVSVSQTDVLNGIIEFAWSPPDTINIQNFPPPYKYLIYQKDSSSSFQLIDSTAALVDTTYTVNGLNTEKQSFTYKVELWSYGSGRLKAGTSFPASSVFLQLSPTDKAIQINWSSVTPWREDSFVVFRKPPNENLFKAIDTTTQTSLLDTGLVNGLNYCYYITSYGSYDLKNIQLPIINLSQELCAKPIDNVSPCPPPFEVESNCERNFIKIKWTLDTGKCNETLLKYQLYYAKKTTTDLKYLAEVDGGTFQYIPSFEENAGCYSILAIDSAGNKSKLAEKVCVDYCPYFELPNVFTPNGDGINDLFVPIPPNNISGSPNYRDIDSIDLKVFNRWGVIVFTTKDPAINWNGFDETNKSLAKDGVYFYNCFVYEKNLEKNKPPRILKGTITILNGKGNKNKISE